MNMAIIDADLIGRKRHRFPNLACEKISGYWKKQGASVILKTDYDALDAYDKVYISKVFTDTPIPVGVLEQPNVEHGGTGFFFDKAPNLPEEIEHHMPDYHLYDDFVNEQLANGAKRTEFKAYLDYSIGFITRGCFRKCAFCVNQKYDRVFEHSPLSEFLDSDRPKICLLDDNFLGCPNWKKLLEELIATGKAFTFKQGLDERLLTDEKCELLFNCKYDGGIYFAFDNIADYELIESKLKLIRRHTDKQLSFYTLTAFDREGRYTEDFWKQDIDGAFKRIELLIKYRCLPYLMKFNRFEESPYRGMYINLQRWCNQPSLFKKMTFREFCTDPRQGKSTRAYMEAFEKAAPEIAARWFNMRWSR